MMEIAVYGLPVRMPHWSFGVRYIYQLIQRHMGISRLFEVVFPGNPGHAYLAASNGLAENILVTAHVLGHADFSRNNLLFQRCQEQVSEHIVEHAATHARQIQQAIETYGARARRAGARCGARARAAHRRRSAPAPGALSGICWPSRSRWSTTRSASASQRWTRPPPVSAQELRKRAPVPPHPERDLLWFIANYAPDLESWERDIFLAVREESFYFYPVFATQIMNEGWASYWHARLLREADFIPQQAYLDAIKCHSDVVRPIAADQQVALSVNPVSPRVLDVGEDHRGAGARGRAPDHGAGRRFRLRAQPPHARAGGRARHVPLQRARRRPGESAGARHDGAARELLQHKYNFGAPTVAAKHVRVDGTLELVHDHERTAAGWTSSAAAKCWTTSTGSGAGQWCYTPWITTARRWSSRSPKAEFGGFSSSSKHHAGSRSIRVAGGIDPPAPRQLPECDRAAASGDGSGSCFHGSRSAEPGSGSLTGYLFAHGHRRIVDRLALARVLGSACRWRASGWAVPGVVVLGASRPPYISVCRTMTDPCSPGRRRRLAEALSVTSDVARGSTLDRPGVLPARDDVLAASPCRSTPWATRRRASATSLLSGRPAAARHCCSKRCCCRQAHRVPKAACSAAPPSRISIRRKNGCSIRSTPRSAASTATARISISSTRRGIRIFSAARSPCSRPWSPRRS